MWPLRHQLETKRTHRRPYLGHTPLGSDERLILAELHTNINLSSHDLKARDQRYRRLSVNQPVLTCADQISDNVFGTCGIFCLNTEKVDEITKPLKKPVVIKEALTSWCVLLFPTERFTHAGSIVTQGQTGSDFRVDVQHVLHPSADQE
ncbi:hypothetical protein Q8A73_022765 [Channa argus]|nr:hypothetical protein Q8A73_022765 [Channa argus]